MRHVIRVLVAGLCFALLDPGAGASEFAEPWKDRSRALVIDPFAGNSIDWEKLATEPRVVGIIHKATVGTSRLDPKYHERRAEAKRRGYLWGSYHWGVAGDGRSQADFYLDTAKPADDELIALDLEDVSNPKLMSIEGALRFIERVKARTGRLPLVYANHRTVALIAKSKSAPAFSGTRLWYARFRPEIPHFPQGPWKTYTLWQFSSEIRVQYRVPGTEADMDVNVFNGTVEQLRAAWPFRE